MSRMTEYALAHPDAEMSAFNTTVLPNPLTPLAFIPPELAYQSTITNYFTVGALAVGISSAC